MDDYNVWREGFQAGYRAALKTLRQETFKDHYEALCDEIRQSTIENIVDIIKEHYNEKD